MDLYLSHHKGQVGQSVELDLSLFIIVVNTLKAVESVGVLVQATICKSVDKSCKCSLGLLLCWHMP